MAPPLLPPMALEPFNATVTLFPTTIPNLVHYVDGKVTGSITTPGGTVTAWDDLSSQGNDGSGYGNPQHASANGRVEFDGNDWLDADGAADTFDGSAYTVIWVGELVSAGDYDALWGAEGSSGGVWTLIYHKTGQGIKASRSDGVDNTTVDLNWSVYGATPHILSMIVDGTNLKFRVDGTETADVSFAYGGGAHTAFQWMAWNDTRVLDGYLHAGLIYASALSTSTLETLEAWLQSRHKTPALP